MTPTDLWALIQSDTQAFAAYVISDDDACAARCSEIAPTIRKPVPAELVQRIASLSGLWGMLKIAAMNQSLSNPPRGAAVSFVDWVECGAELDTDNQSVKVMAATLIEYSLATASQFAEISAAGNVQQIITQQQVGATREWVRVTGGAINGTT
jgi:hypothetical protein